MDNKLNRDLTGVSVSFRIPKYLSDFVESYEDEEKNIKKTDIFRMILEAFYNEPWIIDIVFKNQLNLENLPTDVINEIIKVNMEESENNSEKLLLNMMEVVNSRLKFLERLLERLLGVSLPEIDDMPETVLEQIYAVFKEKKEV